MDTPNTPPAKPITTFPVDSSMIAAIGYGDDSRTLIVEMTDGHQYAYRNVPAELWTAFQDAPSKGTFFGRAVRGGSFQEIKLTGYCPKCFDVGSHGMLCTDCGTASYDREVRKPRKGKA